jgi:hypothetical protein
VVAILCRYSGGEDRPEAAEQGGAAEHRGEQRPGVCVCATDVCVCDVCMSICNAYMCIYVCNVYVYMYVCLCL